MLRRLIADGHITKGVVDERSIRDVQPTDVMGYTRCHFFAGVGLWDYALNLAGWSESAPVWTGSCPCQPFSAAGRQGAQQDDRHLWPEWYRLIKKCGASTIFGEQVSAAVAYGWLDDVYEGLEAAGYAVGSVLLPACSVGAPHRRERLWFVGYADLEGLQGHPRHEQNGGESRRDDPHPKRHPWASGEWLECSDGKARLAEPSIQLLADGDTTRVAVLHAIGDAIVPQVAAAFISAFLDCLSDASHA